MADPGPPFVGHVGVLSRNRTLLGGIASVAVFGVALLAAGALRWVSDAAPLALFAIFWGVFMFLVAYLRNSYPTETRRAIEAGEHGLQVDGLGVTPRGDIVQAYVQPAGSQSVLRIVRTWQSDLVLVASASDAASILRALRLDGAQRTATIVGRSPVAHSIPSWALALGLPAALIGGPLIGSPLPFFAVLGLMLLWAVPSRITVGADGVVVRWLGRRRYIPFSDVVAVTVAGSRVLIHRRDRIVTLQARKRYDPEARQGADDYALATRIGDAFAQHRSGSEVIDPTAVLGRQGRTAPEWIKHVRGIVGAQATGYRTSALTEDQLRRIVSDPSALPSLRAGAAVALAESPDPAARASLKEAADACANPRVRVALETLAEDASEDDWARVLEPIEDDEPQGAAKKA